MKFSTEKSLKCLKSKKEVISEKSKFREERFRLINLETNGLTSLESDAIKLQLLSEYNESSAQ